MIKLAIIGAGQFSYNHKKAIRKNSGCDLVAICDLLEDNARRLAEGTEAVIYTDYHEMLKKEKIDGAILNLPHFLHKSVSVDCLNAGVAVLVEKPMALDVSECDEMIAASKASGAPLTVGHLAGYLPSMVALKKIIDEGTLGTLCAVNEIRTANYFVNRQKWFLDKKLSGGGIMMNLGAHYIDKILYLTEMMPESVYAVNSNMVSDDTVEATSQLLLKLPGNISASGTFSGAQGTGQIETTFYFTKGTAQIRLGTELWISKEGADFAPVIVDEEVSLFDLAMEKQISEFLKLIQGEPNCATTPEHGRNVISVLRKILD